jgi:hypothetical protein
MTDHMPCPDNLLCLHGQVAKFDAPSDRILKAYRSFFYGASGKPQLYEPLSARELSSEDHDYVALCPPMDGDMLSTFMRNHFPAPATVGRPHHSS